MDIVVFSLLLAVFSIHSLQLLAQSTALISSRITVVGAVYCDTCLNNGFSRHSYFIPGADVHVQCKFNANAPKTSEMITFSVNRTTDVYGVYKLEIPAVDGVDCVDGPPIQSFCQASLIGSSSQVCNVPTLKFTTTEVSVKSKQESLCVYSFTPLSFRPSKKNNSLCSKHAKSSLSATSSKHLLRSKQTSSISNAENLQSFPFPFTSPPPSLPFPFPFTSPPPSLPFPFPFTSPPPSLTFPFPFSSPPPSLPFPFPFSSPPPSSPFPFTPFFNSPPPPPAFNPADPKTWIPHIPFISQPPPPPPPPPAFDIRDPRTWTPLIPPFTPPNRQKKNP
ncbi:unnamed protein product [Amaranthus hypochondriacus]